MSDLASSKIPFDKTLELEKPSTTDLIGSLILILYLFKTIKDTKDVMGLVSDWILYK